MGGLGGGGGGTSSALDRAPALERDEGVLLPAEIVHSGRRHWRGGRTA